MLISLIVAMAEDRVIGRDDDLPWYLPDDLRRFRRLTTGHHVLMGRKTHASILARIQKPLPNRVSLVVSRDPDAATTFAAPDVYVFAALEPALDHARAAGENELFVIGGATVYAALLPRADRIHLTEGHARVDGDTRMPPIERPPFVEVDREDHPADDRHEHAYSFVTLERR